MASSAAAAACPVRLRGLDRHRHVHEVDARPELRGGGGERRGGAVSPGRGDAAEAEGSEVETETGVEHSSRRGRGQGRDRGVGRSRDREAGREYSSREIVVAWREQAQVRTSTCISTERETEWVGVCGRDCARERESD